MIIFSFFRRKSTQIYLLLFIILFLLINSTGLLIENIENIKDNNFSSSTLLYIKSETNYESLLKSNKYITNIKRALIFDYGNVKNIDENTAVANTKVDKMTVETGNVVDYSNEMNERAIIGLKELNFINNRYNITKLISDSSVFYYEGVQINLKIKNVINSKKRSELIISDSLFNELITKSNSYIYTASITKTNEAQKIINNLNKQVKGNVILLENLDESEQKIGEALDKNLKYLKAANIVICVISILLFLIINNNNKNDLINEIYLEQVLGFNSFEIKCYLFLRLIVLHVASLLISCLLILILKYFINFPLFLLLIRIIKIIVFIMVYNVITCLMFKTKAEKLFKYR